MCLAGSVMDLKCSTSIVVCCIRFISPYQHYLKQCHLFSHVGSRRRVTFLLIDFKQL